MGLGSAKAHKGRKPAEAKDRQLHVILDNLNTHKKNEHWLKAHPKRPLSFHADQCVLAQSGRGMVLDLARAVAQRRPFTSLKQLQEHIDAYVNAYNDKAEPFVWTKKKIRQRRFKGRRITQL